MKYIIILSFIMLNCHTKDENKNEIFNKSDTIDRRKIDSLEKKGYVFTKEIDFFKLTVKDTLFSLDKESNFYGIKKDDGIINIVILSKGVIILKRKLEKYGNKYYKEDRVIDSSDGGEIFYLTYYYSEERIIVTCQTKSIFEESEVNSYLDEILIIKRDNVIRYSNKTSEVYRKEKLFLSETQLENIDEIAMSLFYNSENVSTYNFPFEKLKNEVFYIWEINDLD